MKQRIPLLLFCVSSLLTLLSSCQKELNNVKKDGIASAPLPGQTTNCRIESIWVNPFMSDNRYHMIGYDEYENPTYISTPFATEGAPFRTFKYDSWHRLREFRGEHANGNFENWHFYGYNKDGRIAVDTNYLSGKITGDRPTIFGDAIISQSFYDAQGRVIYVLNQSMKFGFVTEIFYTYDHNGNLVYPPGSGVAYSIQANINRTNDLWMFLSKDYSVNNPFFADGYNEFFWATKLNNSRPYNWLNSGIFINRSQISYSCRPAYY